MDIQTSAGALYCCVKSVSWAIMCRDTDTDDTDNGACFEAALSWYLSDDYRCDGSDATVLNIPARESLLRTLSHNLLLLFSTRKQPSH